MYELLDVYNMQLSNEPAEELAQLLVDSGNGAFELCGIVSGGSEAMEAVIKLARQVGLVYLERRFSILLMCSVNESFTTK
jgi:acetylornithine/succinyldiaminopimelate/putrescine aminotransferase